mmetsp:Transcript_15637/g.32184  ORF Transcript_15637/g.32184 Transcript_15637/m.32184 type:complete len:147 (-) Transcript_15637:656-1096(-)
MIPLFKAFHFGLLTIRNDLNLAESIEEIESTSENFSLEMYEGKLENNNINLEKSNKKTIKTHKKQISPDIRSSLPFLTKYEKARILGARALQISLGAPVMVNLESQTDSLDIATKELKERKIPITIRRYLPSGEFEDWHLDELIID